MDNLRHQVAQILPTDRPQSFAEAVSKAAELLRAGQVVAVPTETVYGLAANAMNARAVARIFEVKGRPAHNPIIVHVSSVSMAKRCASAWPSVAERLANAFWPGPLTMVLPRAAEIPDVLTAGGPTVGIRWPRHPFIQALIERCDFPLAAPSANLSNRISPTNARHVARQLGQKIPLIIDGGQSHVGIESTVLDLSCEPPRALRPGMIHREALMAVIGPVENQSSQAREPLKSPGSLQKHYSPRAPLIIRNWKNEEDLRIQLAQSGLPISKTHVIAHTNIPCSLDWGCVNVIPHDPEAFARAIYAQLHECDDEGAELIVVEALPETNEWRALRDRLNRAAAT